MSTDKILCPKCYSENIYVDKKGFSTGKAVVGGLLTGNIFVAAAAGGMGSNKIKLTCLNCGHEFKIGEGAKRKPLSSVTSPDAPKYVQPQYVSYECDCGKKFSGKENAQCPVCGRMMKESNRVMKRATLRCDCGHIFRGNVTESHCPKCDKLMTKENVIKYLETPAITNKKTTEADSSWGCYGNAIVGFIAVVLLSLAIMILT